MWVATHVFSAKNIDVFAIFQGRNFNVTLANNVKFWTTGPLTSALVWIISVWDNKSQLIPIFEKFQILRSNFCLHEGVLHLSVYTLVAIDSVSK